MYTILPYTKKKAKKLNVIIKPSKKPGKKIDIFNRSGKYITSIGAYGYMDYPTYKKLFGTEIAEYKKRMYKKRHQSDRLVKGSRGWYADQLLW